MGKLALALATLSLLWVCGCAPVSVGKTYTEEYMDQKTGKKITYTETIHQTPEERMPVHLKHPELYE